jgi:hypothetical protein
MAVTGLGSQDDMTDRETQEAHGTLTQVVDALSELLGRPSRWTGSLELTDSLFSSGVAHLDGRIKITRAVWRQPQYRWRTVVHEALHLCSPPYTSHEYSLSRGWEEGVVEQMQRLFRQEVFLRIGVAMAENAFTERDAAHEYNAYIQALESLRQPLKMSPRDFYTWLLAMLCWNKKSASPSGAFSCWRRRSWEGRNREVLR